jgi:hypothetical protein
MTPRDVRTRRQRDSHHAPQSAFFLPPPPRPHATDAVESPEALTATRSYILHNASIFMELHREAYAIISTTPYAVKYTERYITMAFYDTADAGPDGALRYVNLLEAGINFASCVQTQLFFRLIFCATAVTPSCPPPPVHHRYATRAAALDKASLADDDNPIVKNLFVNHMSGGSANEHM